MRRAVAPLETAAFVVGTLTFVAFVVHVVLTDIPDPVDIIIMVSASLLVCASVILAIRALPRIGETANHADVYAKALEERVGADR
ncbi:hypothetical protein [Nonomuraea sp. NPDC049504]|uniref:hypothetical protein n=1 Tax=Nonomuraea sp. NPDC049504 TaxID=3154729 RepID=UPI003436EF70